MPKTPTAINFSKHRTRHLYLKYYDCLKTHLGHFERNLIGFGYSFDDDVLSHQIAVGDITATVIELDGELICLAEYQFDNYRSDSYRKIPAGGNFGLSMCRQVENRVVSVWNFKG